MRKQIFLQGRFYTFLIVVLAMIVGPSFAQKDFGAFQEPSLSDFSLSSNVGFVQNKGQMIDDVGNPAHYVLFRANIGSTDLFVTKDGLTYLFNNWREAETKELLPALMTEPAMEIEQFRIDVDLKGANIDPAKVHFEDIMEGTSSNYFLAHCPDGIFDVNTFKKVVIEDVYPGIDWVFKQTMEGVKYDFVVHPGADPSQITMHYEGAELLELSKRRQALEFGCSLGSIKEGKLFSYQLGADDIQSSYQLDNNIIKFEISEYDRNDDLVIDPPLVLDWATYYGGSSNEGGNGICTDLNGNIFITGFVTSTNFPTFNPGGAHVQAANAGGAAGGNGWADAFIVKFDKDGARQWATYYGGTGDDRGESVSTDNVGNLYVVGGSSSPDLPLQNLAGAYNQVTAPVGGSGLHDVMILKFNNNGGRLWATYYGGDDKDVGMAVTTDAAGSVYITGFAGCNNFPLTNPGGGAYFQNVYGGGGCNNFVISGDAFVVKLNNAGAVVWSTLLGGNGGDVGLGIALDNAGNIIVVGEAQSTNFPTQNLAGAFFQGNVAGNGFLWGDVTITKFSPTFNMLWSTYCGGDFSDVAQDLAIDSNGNIYVVGSSASTNFPIVNLPGSYNQAVTGGPTGQFGYGDAFILKFDNVGAMTWSTYYGGTAKDEFMSVVVDRCDNVYIGGFTQSAGFATVNPGATYFFDGIYNGSGFYGNTVLTSFDKNGVHNWATHYGRGGCAQHLTIDEVGKVTLAGEAWGGGFQLANPGNGAYYDPTFNGTPNDLLIARFAPVPLDLSNNSKTDALCFGQPGGTATVNPSGGVAPYTYSWNTNPPQTGATATGLLAGTYSVTVFDANCSIDTLSFTITEPPQLQAFVPTQTNIACAGEVTGTATAGQLGGTSPYSYAWSNAQTTITATGLGAGSYTITITDQNGCTAQTNTTITEPPVISTTVTVQNEVSCNGGNDGAVLVNAAGGAGGFSYQWSPGGTSGASASNLSAGSYSVIVTDNNGCTVQGTASITEPLALQASSSASPSFCNQSVGSASAQISGGTPGYSYVWNTQPSQTSQQATGLASGTYSFTATDLNGCTIQGSAVVPSQSPDTLTAQTLTDPSCFGACDGVATMTLSGQANGPYNYQWNVLPNQNSLTATGLCAGVYTCTVTDGNGCTDTMSVSLSQPTAVTLANGGQTDVSCFGDSDGAATIQASGGTPQYAYAWSSGGADNNATGLAAGVYTCTVTDNNGCVNTATVSISEPQQLVANGGAPVSICEGQSTNLYVNVNGGTPGYNYQWSSGNTGTPVNVTPTTTTSYSVTVTDANGCNAEALTTVSVNALPVVAFDEDVTEGCPVLCVNFTNSTLNTASVVWDFGDGNASTSNPGANNCFSDEGVYSVSLTVTDVNGCSATLEKLNLITVYPKPVASFTATPQPTSILSPNVYFTDQSTGAVTWNWSFGDVTGSSSTFRNPNFIYPDTGLYAVQLIVTNEFGCMDTTEDIVQIDPDYILYVPNTYTPNGDGINDVFIPQGIGLDEEDYKLLIYDRWGDQIFESTNPSVGWNGRANGGAEQAQEDTYVWKVILRDVFGKRHAYVGHVNLIR